MESKLVEKGYGKRYKEACIQYAEGLINQGLPVVFDNKHLSLLMGIERNVLGYYIISATKFYKEYQDL
ncbi:hypothetical protein [Paenibacillus ottowii]|uniref:hypothetical protein n=1 Tax=Paenibacillus ottowii TaxID=2315729 RepID=UPI003D2EE6CA